MTYSIVPSSHYGNPAEMALAPWPDEHGVVVLPPETRAAVTQRLMSLDEWVATLEGQQPTASGLPMSADRSLGVAAVCACVRVIAEDTAKLPRHLMIRSEEDGRQRTRKATGDPRFALLTSAPNDWMTGQELIEYMVGQAALRGAAYARLVREQGPEGPVTEILPLLPGRCRRVQDEHDWSVAYEINGYGHGTEHVGPRDIWCINGPMMGTITGADMSANAREAVALAQALEGSQARFHAGDSRPSGILASKGAITQAQRDNIRAAWRAAYGPGGSGGIAVLGDDFDFKSIATSAADSQLIESRQFQIIDICRFFRVHPWAIMHQQSTQAYASIEQTALAHIQHTIMPWVGRVEQTVHRDILDRDASLFLKLNMNALARSTLTDRVNAYKSATTVYMTPNEARVLEDMDELDDPAMDMVQLPQNNTGIARSSDAPSASQRGNRRADTAPAE